MCQEYPVSRDSPMDVPFQQIYILLYNNTIKILVSVNVSYDVGH